MADTNRLAAESSPYLLQHAHNPVDWYPWGPEAFEAARQQNKCIFLSVGYSTCYWCHVMERQSFENAAIAAEMNKRFINIKVDREERPDVDQVYMIAVQLITRQGGWPMSLFLTPELKPFYGGTYFPPADGHGRPGFGRILAAVEDAYRNRPEEVAKSAGQITRLLGQMAQPPAVASPTNIDEQWIESLIERSTADYESVHGGFGSAPKFPRQTLLELLLVYLRDHPKDQLLRQVRHTLDAMAQGGIRDQLGGGFHRYSTDAEWLVPHFEIMLYDNAMLAWIYTEAYRQTEDLRYAAVARGICDFVLREMTAPGGAFYTAFDAEVDAREGLSYLWTRDEAREVLREGGISDLEIERFCRIYGLDQGPNFADPHHGNGMAEMNILYLAEPGAGGTAALLDASLAPMRELLYAARLKRKQPSLDHKILTSWNALMIRALAYASEVLQEDRYLKAAEAAADFLLKRHRDGDGGLFRVSTGGDAKVSGFLDDYAYLVQALLALDEAGDDERRRDQAGELSAVMRERFGDPNAGGFYFNDERATDLIVRQKIGTDSPLPSGNGVAAMVMLELEQADVVREIISAFAGQMDQGGEGMSALVQAALLYVKQHGALVATGSIRNNESRPPGPAQAAGQVLALRAEWQSPTRLNVLVKVAKGFHVNTHEASDGLLATQLSINGKAAEDVAGIDYPPGEEQRLAFSESPVRVYSGEFVIAVRFVRPAGGAVGLSLYYQACDDRACLPPVSKALEVPLP